jgi:beta-N-acetylhexosaminidase
MSASKRVEPPKRVELVETRVSTGSTHQLAARTLLPGFEGTTLPGWLEARLRSGLAGVCLFATNIESPRQVRALTDAIRAANPDALIAIDEEGGDVTRLHQASGSPTPGNAVLGRLDDPALTRGVGEAIGWELRRAGVNLDFAPDVDVNSNPLNPVIGVRSFGATPELVARHTAAFIDGLQSTGVAACAKHFPGHGDTAQDSHLALPVVDLPLGVLRRRELAPFAAAVESGALSVMTSHILLPQVDPGIPATFSTVILDRLLRGELGFDGVIVSDALDMAGASAETGIPEAAVRALAAGCDLLCIGTANTDAQLGEIEDTIAAAVESGRLPAERVADAGDRNVALARRLAESGREVSTGSTHQGGSTHQVGAFDERLTIRAFDVRPGTTISAVRTVVALETTANIAVGDSPWGPTVDARVHEGEPLPEVLGQLVLVGRDNHRRPWTRDVIDGARLKHPMVVVVDLGWPGDDRAYADVATFGASAHVGAALDRWLGESAS